MRPPQEMGTVPIFTAQPTTLWQVGTVPSGNRLIE